MNIKLRFPCQARNDKRGQNRLLTRPSILNEKNYFLETGSISIVNSPRKTRSDKPDCSSSSPCFLALNTFFWRIHRYSKSCRVAWIAGGRCGKRSAFSEEYRCTDTI